MVWKLLLGELLLSVLGFTNSKCRQDSETILIVSFANLAGILKLRLLSTAAEICVLRFNVKTFEVFERLKRPMTYLEPFQY